MVDMEFDAIWRSVEEARKRGDQDPTITGKSDDDLKKEFRGIAERRGGVGVFPSEGGGASNIQVAHEKGQPAPSAGTPPAPGHRGTRGKMYPSTPVTQR